MKILTIEDDPIMWQALKNALEQWNFEVIISEGMMNVLNIFLKKEKPKLVLMDVMLPYFNGYYWCEEWIPDNFFKGYSFVLNGCQIIQC